ncbi:hypothetical protein DEO72_LG11g1952 [Vigna unguiculata]|uniref:Uncharacterized protein n=1 Tax=Vigna unguiculata TaxID=3917 RepID=A0A4D6NMT3_VIGUN|nr:hypothetical protein DEO72_LG11g1952 [Vigna unguiculata]
MPERSHLVAPSPENTVSIVAPVSSRLHRLLLAPTTTTVSPSSRLHCATVNHHCVFFITKPPPAGAHHNRNPSVFTSRRHHRACTILAHVKTKHYCIMSAHEICSDQLKALLRCLHHHRLCSTYCRNHHCSDTRGTCSSHGHSRNHHQTFIDLIHREPAGLRLLHRDGSAGRRYTKSS